MEIFPFAQPIAELIEQVGYPRNDFGTTFLVLNVNVRNFNQDETG